MEKIISARFTKKTASGVVVEFTVSAPLDRDSKAALYVDGKKAETVSVMPRETSKNGGIAVFSAVTEANFDFTSEYTLSVSGASGVVHISKAAFVDDVEFIKTFENADTLSCEYGAIVRGGKTRFCVWAPFATAVKVKLYHANGAVTEPLNRRVVRGAWGGVWELETDGELFGVYYNYIILNGETETETIDPYAKACDANGARGMIVDLKKTDPPDWEKDKHLYVTHPEAADTPIVWEVHVGDFSVSPDSGMKYKGKYLAFTEEDTCVPGRPDLKTGVNYLKDLGITYVQLNPVYDFATVDEGDLGRADGTKDNFNWGYDPQNYNIPEGSYSTDPNRGEVRINEFKRMVMALHKAGIGVVMDVVYNHTYTVSGQALGDTAPGYYHRTDERGEPTNGSGCGNETASERAMMRKYIIDSVLYWATEYHIDGFRFDLMGLHDKVTAEKIRAALDGLYNRNGKRLLMYGEPWSADGAFVPTSFVSRIKASGETDNTLIKICNLASLPARVALFNDAARDCMRGNNDPGVGWVQGNKSCAGTVAAMLSAEAKGLGLGSRNVVYTSAHDNYTLWDQSIGVEAGKETPLYYEHAVDYALRRCKLASAAYLMSPGIAFMLAGEEMGRTKYGNHNSYNSPYKLNMIIWSRQEGFSELVAHYKALIAARRGNARLFSYERSATYSHCGRFCADGLRVSGERDGLFLMLDAENGTGEVKISGETIVSF